jgi:hypothetical protein
MNMSNTKEKEAPVIIPTTTPTEDPSKIKFPKPNVLPKPQA